MMKPKKVLEMADALLGAYYSHLVSIEPDEPGYCPSCSGGPDGVCWIHQQMPLVKQARRDLGDIAARLAAADELAEEAAKTVAQFDGVTAWPTVGIEVTIGNLNAALRGWREAGEEAE